MASREELRELMKDVCREEMAEEAGRRSLAAIDVTVAALGAKVDNLEAALDTFYSLYAGALVFVMQVGRLMGSIVPWLGTMPAWPTLHHVVLRAPRASPRRLPSSPKAGFFLVCAGSLREKNVRNIMLKNLLDACVGALGFWVFGYGVAYGHRGDGHDPDGSYTLIGTDWVSSLAFPWIMPTTPLCSHQSQPPRAVSWD